MGARSRPRAALITCFFAVLGPATARPTAFEEPEETGAGNSPQRSLQCDLSAHQKANSQCDLPEILPPICRSEPL